MILSIFTISLILIIWFKTEAFIEYCRIFRLNRISWYKDYDEKKLNDVSLTYHEYLRQYHNCFWVRLMTCPICVSIWWSILFSISLGSIFPLPILCIMSLILFGTVHKLLG